MHQIGWDYTIARQVSHSQPCSALVQVCRSPHIQQR